MPNIDSILALLDRAVQAVYAMKNLIQEVSTEDGEERVIRRLASIDKARSMFNSMAIDADGEAYEFKQVTLSGAKDILDAACNMLSVVTSIPQTVLFGRSPAGENATGTSDFENYYNLVERLQKAMLYSNLKTLSDVIFRAAVQNGELDEKSKGKIKFKPLWSLSENEQADVDQKRAQTSMIKAQTAQIYVEMSVVDPTEIRRGLADNNEFEIEKMLDNLPEGDLMAGWEQGAENEVDGDVQNFQKSQNDLLTKDGAGVILKTDADDVEFITVNGAVVPIKNGELKGMVGGKIENEPVGEASAESGESVFKKGFSKNNLAEHFGNGGFHDHSREYPGYTKQQYADEALALIQKPIGEGVRGHKNARGQVTRYEKSSNNFVKGHPEKGIATMFKPTDGEAYYERILKVEKQEGGKNG